MPGATGAHGQPHGGITGAPGGGNGNGNSGGGGGGPREGAGAGASGMYMPQPGQGGQRPAMQDSLPYNPTSADLLTVVGSKGGGGLVFGCHQQVGVRQTLDRCTQGIGEWWTNLGFPFRLFW